MIKTRNVKEEDASQLASLVTHLGYPVSSSELWQRVTRMPSDSHHTFVATSNDQVVGFIGLLSLSVYENPKPVGWILALSVSTEHHRNGIGKALLAAAVCTAKKPIFSTKRWVSKRLGIVS